MRAVEARVEEDEEEDGEVQDRGEEGGEEEEVRRVRELWERSAELLQSEQEWQKYHIRWERVTHEEDRAETDP